MNTKSIHKVERQIKQFREGNQIQQANLKNITSRLSRQATTMNKSIINTNQKNLQQHKITHSKLDHLSQELAHTRISTRNSGREIRFCGNNQNDMLRSLLLLQPSFREAIFNILSQNDKLVSVQTLYSLQSEFENLVVSTT